MTITRKEKVEVLLTPTIKASFEAVCKEKGISIADGLRRAIENWISHAANRQPK
jgi:hypothetical protein